jgi:DNA-binding CsgD family transcriptional regulator
VQGCVFAGRVREAVDTAKDARELAPRDGGALDALTEFALGEALAFAGYPEEAAPHLEHTIELAVGRAYVGAAIAHCLLDRPGRGAEVATAATRVAREQSPRALAFAIEPVAWASLRAGRWQRAAVAAEEGLALAAEMGQEGLVANFLTELAQIDAGRGAEESCRARLAQAAEASYRHGLGLLRVWGRCVEGLLELGLGRPGSAVDVLVEATNDVASLGLFSRDSAPEPDLIEALARLQRTDEARQLLETWTGRAPRTGPVWGCATLARCRGILASDGRFEEHFHEALDLHESADDPFGVARTLLCLGERLRRAGARREARLRLHEALDLFVEREAVPWVERVKSELRASGERLRRAVPEAGEELTPQELQIALQVAEGKSNKEVGAALYLSPKTVEFHLSRVYRKLDVASRAELVRRFAHEPVGVS